MAKRTRVYYPIYLFVFLNSISGLKVSGIGVNRLVNIAFLLYIIVFGRIYGRESLVVRKTPLLLFFCSCLISCAVPMMYTYGVSQGSTLVSFSLNVLTYVLIYALLSGLKYSRKKEVCYHFRKALLLTARIQVIWGLLQFVLYYAVGLNINEIVFRVLLNTDEGGSWSLMFFSGGSWKLRISGLNYEGAIFVIILAIAYALEKKWQWKVVYALGVVLSLSRTGFFTLLMLMILDICRSISSGGRVKRRSVALIALVLLSATAMSLLILRSNGAIRQQAETLVVRLLNKTSSNQVSTSRHLLYYPYGAYIWAMRSNILQQLFGYGMRCSGIPFMENTDIASSLGIIPSSYTSTWAVECDVIGLLLGGGIITALLYYYTLGSIYVDKRNPFRQAIAAIAIAGVMYHFHSISYVIYVIVFAYVSSELPIYHKVNVAITNRMQGDVEYKEKRYAGSVD